MRSFRSLFKLVVKKNKQEARITQEKVSKEETADLVKIIKAINPGNLLRALEIGLQSLMDAETSIILGATPYERTSNRKTYRNGTRVKGVNSAMGKLTTLIPKFRKGSYFPSVLEKFKGTDRVLISVISQAYINGVSTRKMDDLFVEMINSEENLNFKCLGTILSEPVRKGIRIN